MTDSTRGEQYVIDDKVFPSWQNWRPLRVQTVRPD
jgi:hypothetical protein